MKELYLFEEGLLVLGTGERRVGPRDEHLAHERLRLARHLADARVVHGDRSPAEHLVFFEIRQNELASSRHLESKAQLYLERALEGDFLEQVLALLARLAVQVANSGGVVSGRGQLHPRLLSVNSIGINS